MKDSFFQTQVDIYKLNPNSTYLFQLWATNRLGSSEITNVTAKTLHDSQEIGKIAEMSSQ